MVTILDVAKKADVSPSTVSHVLNGKRPISRETKEKVFLAIKELGYEPNPNAQALRNTSTGIIGFFLSGISEAFAYQIIQGVERVVRERNSYLLFATGVNNTNNFQEAIQFLRKRRFDGLIISCGVRQIIQLEELKELNVPIITINTRVHDTIASVQPDNYRGGQDAAVHLLECGVRQPAMIAGPKGRLSSEERMSGFIDKLGENGIHVNRDESIAYGDYEFNSGVEGLSKLLSNGRPIDGVFCANDLMAAGAIQTAINLNMEVPDQIKILGFDNREISSIWPISISTFTLPMKRIGEASAKRLFSLIDGIPLDETHITIPSTLIKRKSTDNSLKNQDAVKT